MVMLEMTKKQPTQDGRSLKTTPITLESMKAFRDKLIAIAGDAKGLCVAMEKDGDASVQAPGKAMAMRGIRSLELFMGNVERAMTRKPFRF